MTRRVAGQAAHYEGKIMRDTLNACRVPFVNGDAQARVVVLDRDDVIKIAASTDR